MTTPALSDIQLTLFFTRRVGLYLWEAVGNLEREVAIYRELGTRLGKVAFVTYGGSRDRPYAEQLDPIEIHATPRHLPVAASKTILRLFHEDVLRQSDIFKSNQIAGAEIALWAKKRYGKRLITRCGYLLSRFVEQSGQSGTQLRKALQLERDAFAAADAGVVTSERDRQWVIENHGIEPDRMHVIPNYVLTDVFRPLEGEKAYDLVCVARDSPQKNLAALLGAMCELKQHRKGPSLLLIGSAAQSEAVRRKVRECQLDVALVARVPHRELPIHLNCARAFVLPSLYEGHPKVLLEAMSCGLPCIGTRVVGIRDDIEHLQTGYLCGTDAHSLAEAIETVLGNCDLQKHLGDNARRYVLERYSLRAILELELAVIAQVMQQ